MRRLSALVAGLVAIAIQPAHAETDSPPVMHVGLNGGYGPVLASTRADTTGFSWGVSLEGYAEGIGQSGLGLREIRLQRVLNGQPYSENLRQIRLRSSVATFFDRTLVASWQGGVLMQEFERNGLKGAQAGLGVTDSHIGGELGARIDWQMLKQFAPYLGFSAIFGDLGNPAALATPTTPAAPGVPQQTGGTSFGLTGSVGITSRWPLTIPVGEARYVADLGGSGEVYWLNLFDEHLVGLDLRLGVYF